MNKYLKVFSLCAIAALLACMPGLVQAQRKKGAAPGATKAAKAGAASKATTPTSAAASTSPDEYFMISSVDKAHSALIVLRPTQITATLIVNDKTQFADENGKPLKLTDFRTGDTVFASFTTQAGGVLTAVRVRKGMMTMAEMRKRYLPGLPVVTSPSGLGH